MRAAALSSRREQIALYTGNDDNIVIDLLTKYQFTVNGTVYEKRFCGGLLGHWSVWVKRVVELFESIKAEADKDMLSAQMLVLANEITDATAALFDTGAWFCRLYRWVALCAQKAGLI